MNEKNGRAPGAASPPKAWVPDRPRRRGSMPALLGEILVGTQEYIAQKTGMLMPQEEWRRIVGPKIAGRTRVGRAVRGVLTVKVASAAWSSELTFLKPELLGRLQQNGYELSDLKFRVEQGLAPAPLERKRPGYAARAPVVEPLPAELELRLLAIEDPNLRAAIREAARLCLSGPKRSPAR